jgi:hypothetical protein
MLCLAVNLSCLLLSFFTYIAFTGYLTSVTMIMNYAIGLMRSNVMLKSRAFWGLAPCRMLNSYPSKHLTLAVPWLRRLVVGLTADGRVRSRVSSCEICGGQSGTGTCFSPSTSVFPSQFHSIGAPLLGKTKKLSSLSQGCTISLKAAVRL